MNGIEFNNITKDAATRAIGDLTQLLHQAGSGLSDLSKQSHWIGADITFLERAIQDCTVKFSPAIPSTGMQAVYQGFGVTSLLNIPIGVNQVGNDVEALRSASKMRDTYGQFMATMGLVKGPLFIGGSILFVVYRVLATLQLALKSPAMSLIGRIAYGAAYIGTILFAGFCLTLSVIFGCKIVEGIKWKNKLSKKTPEEAIAWLEKKVTPPTPESIERKMSKSKGEKRVGLDGMYIQPDLSCLRAEGEKIIADGLKRAAALLGVDLKEITPEEVTDAVEKWIKERSPSADLSAVLRHVALQDRATKLHAKRLAQFNRVIGPAGVEAITQPVDVLSSDSGRIAEIQGFANKKLRENIFVFLGVTIGVAAMIMSIICTAGLSLTIGLVVMACFAISMLGIDIHYLIKSYQSGQLLRHDKKMLVASSGLGIGIAGALIGLGASGIITFGIVPLFLTIALLFGCVGTNIATYFVGIHNEREHEKNNPTLQVLLEEVKNFLNDPLSTKLSTKDDGAEFSSLYEKFYERMNGEKVRELLEGDYPLLESEVEESAIQEAIEKLKEAIEKKIKEAEERRAQLRKEVNEIWQSVSCSQFEKTG